MIITISGTAGSGKSTVSKQLVEKLNAKRIYVGGIRRELAREKGMTLEELNEYAKTHEETDVGVDRKAAEEARKLSRDNDYVIVEGRTQFHFLPESLKIFIKVDFNEAAKRIWKDLQSEKKREQRNEAMYESLEAMKKRIFEREEEDAQRYLKYYDIDHRDESQYDLVIDSTHISAEEVTSKILDFLKQQ